MQKKNVSVFVFLLKDFYYICQQRIIRRVKSWFSCNSLVFFCYDLLFFIVGSIYGNLFFNFIQSVQGFKGRDIWIRELSVQVLGIINGCLELSIICIVVVVEILIFDIVKYFCFCGSEGRMYVIFCLLIIREQ